MRDHSHDHSKASFGASFFDRTPSLMMASGGARLAVACGLAGALWLAVLWALN